MFSRHPWQRISKEFASFVEQPMLNQSGRANAAGALRSGVIAALIGMALLACGDRGTPGSAGQDALSPTSPSLPATSSVNPGTDPANPNPTGAIPDGTNPTAPATGGPGDVPGTDPTIPSATVPNPTVATPSTPIVPISTCETIQSIAGTWTFVPSTGAPAPIEVPGGGWFKQGFTAPSGTYQTSITVPDMGCPQTVRLEFGAINHEATLAIDGVTVATNMTAFTPSVFDITRFVQPGQTYPITILVRGRDAFLNGGRRAVPHAAAWSPNVPQGIFRSAVLHAYPDVFISDAFVRTSVQQDTLTYDVSITNSGASPRQVVLSSALQGAAGLPAAYPSIPELAVTIAAGQTSQVTLGPVAWGIGPGSYWWPNVPYREDYQATLHDLHLTLEEAGQPIEQRAYRFGFREIEQRPDTPGHVYYFLNGVRVNFRGDSLQGVDYDSIDFAGGRGDAYDTFPGFLPPSADNAGWPGAVRNYQRLGFNVVRIHQEPATPYMLDVADQLGLMIINESAIRGTDDQDFVIGHDAMVGHVRDLVLRDRNHPSIIRFSTSNEANINPTSSLAFVDELYDTVVGLDPTRPISVDVSGTSDAYDAIAHPNLSVYGHYLNGLGLYTDEVSVRTDRPFGQGEFVWPNDVTRQGLLWFATGTMHMRLKDASEIRPYTLLSAWASVIPGVTTDMMRLEPTFPEGAINPPLFGEDNLSDPFNNPILVRVQRAFNPVLVADIDYWAANKQSNAQGDFPVTIPALPLGADVTRDLVVFNDTFAGTSVSVEWELRTDAVDGVLADSGSVTLDVPLGFQTPTAITMQTPALGARAFLILRAQKDGVLLFEDSLEFSL